MVEAVSGEMCTKCAVKMTVDECSVKKEVLGLEHE
jgi:hypothetical protein